MSTDNNPIIACQKCRLHLPVELFNSDGVALCPSCQTKFHAFVFPAMYRTIEAGSDGASLLTDEDASCFYHSSKQAVINCESCGRFLCTLCDIEIGDKHLCPACIESGVKKEKIKDIRKERIMYDQVALSLSILPLLFFYFVTIITAPITIFIVIRRWNAPSSVVPRTKGRFVAAFIIALVQIVMWIFAIGAIATNN